MPLNISLILSSMRPNSQGHKPAKFIFDKCKERDINITLIDPKEFKLPVLDRMYKEYPKGSAPENLEKLHNIFAASDGFILLTGEYNHSLPPALTNLMDYFREEYFFKAAAIACYSGGPIAGMRSAMQARTFCGELGLTSQRTILGFPNIQNAFDKDGNPTDESMHSKIKRFLDELEWYANALKEARAKGLPY
jgi:NAD(P)H-dependent FMN reductase